MLDKYYCSLDSKIKPSEELIRQTKSKMYSELNRKSNPVPKRNYQFGTIAACFVLIVAVLFTPLLKNKLAGNQRLQIGLGNDLGEKREESWYSEDMERNLNNEEIAEANIADKSLGTEIVKQLSEGEAYSLEGYGRLLPKSMLSGYKFELASIYNNNTPSKILRFIYHTSGYNYIAVNVRAVQPEDKARMVKVKETEKYDITKYTIPFADSIPQNLYDTMHNPIFQTGELTKEVLSLRKITTHEQGDDKGGEVMRFAIQCGEFLIEYNIKGNSLEGVFDMVTSSDYFTKRA